MNLVMLIVGVLIGFILAVASIYTLLVGTMIIYIPDTDEKPCAGFKWDRALDFISQRKFVLFKVDVKHLNSQE